MWLERITQKNTDDWEISIGVPVLKEKSFVADKPKIDPDGVWAVSWNTDDWENLIGVLLFEKKFFRGGKAKVIPYIVYVINSWLR